MDMVRRPLARSEELITEELGDALLVYDERTDYGHCLSPEATRVWRRCDGVTPVDGLAAQVDLDPETVRRALDELDTCGLLETPTLDNGTTRRELSVKMVRAGGLAALTPLVYSVLAPTAAAVQTINCTGVGDCLFNCGQTVRGCQGGSGQNAACTCCNISAASGCGINNGCTQPSNIKRCVSGGSANCPATNTTICCVCGPPPCPNPAGC